MNSIVLTRLGLCGGLFNPIYTVIAMIVAYIRGPSFAAFLTDNLYQVSKDDKQLFNKNKHVPHKPRGQVDTYNKLRSHIERNKLDPEDVDNIIQEIT